MKAFKLALLASAVLLTPASLAFSQECAKQPVTVGFLPKLDTDPYFKVAQQGVRVVSYDSDVAGAARSIFVNQAKGDSLAEMMLESAYNLIGGEGEFAILSSTPTATNQNAWIDFMKKKMAAEPKFAKMKLVQVAYGEESKQINQQQALAPVQAFPNLKAIIFPRR